MLRRHVRNYDGVGAMFFGRDLNLLIFCVSFLPSSFLNAEAATWISNSHFGIAIEEKSDLGFDRSAGTVLFFDFERHIYSDFNLGIRSYGSGATTSSAQFYRLMSGPLLTWSVFDRRWNIQIFPSLFQESSQSNAGESCVSRGFAMMVGWERNWKLGERVDLITGAFYIRHWGQIRSYNIDTSSEVTISPIFAGLSRNDGQSRGVEIALRTTL